MCFGNQYLDIDDGKEFSNFPWKPNESNMFFEHFMDRLFVHRSIQSILKFRLQLYGIYDLTRVNSWTSHLSGWISSAAIMRNVEELSLTSYCPVHLPDNLFHCEKLVSLELYGDVRFDYPESVCLPSLEVLHLEYLPLLDNASKEMLLSGTLALEELKLVMTDCVSEKSVHLHSLSLKHLMMTFISDSDPYDDDFRIRVTINAPNLGFLQLVDFASEELTMLLPNTLIEADLCFGYHTAVFNVEFEEYADMVVQFLRQISVISILRLSEYNMQILFAADKYELPCLGNLPAFGNLAHLEVTVRENQFLILPQILDCSPNLKVFVIFMADDASDWQWRPPQSVPQCLTSCLEVIGFISFTAGSEETEIVEYFLRNAMLLKKMVIRYQIDINDAEVDVDKRLSMCAKGSNACEIEISWEP